MLIFRLRPGMIQTCELLWCLLGSHGIKTQQCKDKLNLMAGLSMSYNTKEWHFSSHMVPLESLNKQVLSKDVGLSR